jgi:hypothetical protein
MKRLPTTITVALLVFVGLLLWTASSQAATRATGACASTLCVGLSPHPQRGHNVTLTVHINTSDFGPQLTLRYTGLLHWSLKSETSGCQGTYDRPWSISGWGNGNDWRYNHFHPADECDLSFTLVPQRVGVQRISVRVYRQGTANGGIEPGSEFKSLAWHWSGKVQ